MKLDQFITYCTLKDLIVLHKRLDNEWVANAVNKQKLVIENDDFLATIIYTHFTKKYSILSASLTEVLTTYDKDTIETDLGTIIEKFA